MMKKTILISVLVMAITSVFAKDQSLSTSIKPYANIQYWTLQSYDYETGVEVVDNRMGSYFRRGRLGLKGQFMDRISYDFMLSFDYLGKQTNLSAKGKVNASTISVWSAYFTYQPFEKSQWLMHTGGTFLPHLSRESVTSPWTTSSLDKAETSCYLRRFVTGKTNGICPGINVGGLGNLGKNQLMYNVSVISRQDNSSITNLKYNPVLLGHVVYTFGDKEWSKYKYTFSGNSLKKQNLLSIGLGGSTQGETDAFKYSSTYGIDFLWYFNRFKLDGEYYFMDRENEENYLANSFMLRAGYNISLKNNWILEPAVMFCRFNGDDNYSDASFYDGEDQIIDAGVNFISSGNKVRLNLHYINRVGEATSNHRVTSSGSYGDYLNLGIQFKI